ncbi:restriction endonuclease subunit S [Levilactobacillus brevis]|nr:restriction endonuclease subunit S [Levilactobacillus brevis]MDV2565578.1 restriction endonuclease subunit S [Levilactobacillus brevis]MDV2584879.1 restriction endonuclease subunit S [Levilactobacillus brevis]
MKDNQAKYPQLRFKGFTNPWEQRKLGEIVAIKITNGLMNRPGGNLLAVKDINVVNMYTPDHIHVEDLEYFNATDKDLSRCDVTKGDVFVTRSSLKAEGIAEPNVLLENGRFVFDDHLMRLKPRPEINPYFLKELLSSTSVKKQFIAKAKTATMTTIGQQDISTSDARFPSSTEQKLIAELLQKIDSTIALHQRKLAKLKELKQSYLQKLFPENGSKFPQLRFSGFADAWEQRKLGELADIVGGGTPSTNNDEYWNGDIDWYSPVEINNQIYVSGSKNKITELGLQKSSAKVLPIGTVLFTSRAGIGKTAILAKKGTTNQGFQSILPHENKLDSYFIFSRTDELKRYGETNGAGSTFVEVSGKQMSKMPIMLPKIEEQMRIGTFFQQLDNLITLHQRKLEKLQELKKGYLQKMFC